MIRRITTIVLALSLLMACCLPAVAEGPPTIQVDGRILSVDVPPIIVEGRTLVPTRAICEALGAEVSWNQAEQSVTINHDGSELILLLGSQYATYNGQVLTMEVPAQMVSDRVLVPLRFIAETMLCQVDYDSVSNLITIITNGQQSSYETLPGTWIIYTKQAGQNTVLKISEAMSLESSAVFSSSICSSLAVHDGWVYGASMENRIWHIFRMRPDGSNIQKCGQLSNPNVLYTSSGIYSVEAEGDIWRCSWDFQQIEKVIPGGFLIIGAPFALTSHDAGYFVWQDWNTGVNYSSPVSDCSVKYKLIEGPLADKNKYNMEYRGSDSEYHYLVFDPLASGEMEYAYRIPVHGGVPEKVSTQPAGDILCQTSQYLYLSGPDGQIRRTAKKGGEEELAIDCITGTPAMQACGEWIYYSANDGVYKMRLDGSDSTIVSDDPASSFVVYNP